MKHYFIFALITFFSFTISLGQTTHEINKLDKEVELLQDSAAKHMVDFILTQEAAEYSLAISKSARAEEMNQKLTEEANVEKGIAKKNETSILIDREEEFDSYKDLSIKDLVLNEKSTDRNIKVKHNGQTYNLSEKSKKIYDVFMSYLPRN